MKADGYIVVYDDGQGVEFAYGWDSDCDGALAYSRPVVVFPDRKAARRAIRISAAHAKLLIEQGIIASDDSDFIPPYQANIRIVPVLCVAGKDGAK